MAVTTFLPADEERLLGNPDDYLQDSHGRRDSQKIRGWDVFNLLPQEERDDTETSKLLEISRKAFKVASYAFSFVVVLSTAVLAKGALLLMTSMAQPRKKLSACPKHQDFSKGDKNNREYELTVRIEEMVAWAWCLYFVLILPDVFALLRSIRICIFKSFALPRMKTFLVELVASTCHSVGLTLLVFCVFPLLDVVQAIMLTSCVYLVPGLVQLLSHHCSEERVSLRIFFDLLALSAQLSGFLICILQGFKIEMAQGHQWIIPFALFLVSFAWWENFVPAKSQYKWTLHLLEIKRDLRDSRYFLQVFLSVWKMILSLVVMLIWYKIQLGDDFNQIFTKFMECFSDLPNVLTRTKYLDTQTSLVMSSKLSHMNQTINSNGLMPVYVATCQVIACWLCYVTAKFACRTCIQGFGFALPLHLTSPLLLSVMVAACDANWSNVCVFKWFSPYVFWTCPQGNTASYHVENYGYLWVLWLLWLFSQVWFTLHVWMPKSERLASTEKLSVNPMYCSAILDQSLLLNRRREEETENEEVHNAKVGSRHSSFYKGMPDSMGTLSILETEPAVRNSDYVTRIYACATMWHETKEEMIQLLKSLFRMDEDQSARRNAQKFIKIIDNDYYEFQAHIFFDDAFEEMDLNNGECGIVVNEFVKLLIGAIDVAASNVHNCLIKLKPPKKIPTPYGGRLVWRMPGGNELVAHLKDKQKIRHKKRWSQVMYMYYLLGKGIMESEPEEVERKNIRAENSYILALDGDINFRPLAVQLLVDLMKKNKALGAACGRIHPVGSGPMVWYQKFEYAIGHWLQKATEHMIGCVLCSPGCFSLFRAKALMDDNVMRKYTTMSEAAKDYVQYDQGEDRWLCTLLLQRGYRVEYCAASDAYTHCPEGFDEFYNQRRRWAPSTMANIMDLLSEYKSTVAVNDSISMPYIAYQLMMMIGSILGPGTIFLMLVGAMVAAFRIPNVEAFLANFIPIVMYIIICFIAKNDFQILVAQILSAAYALLMMAVLVGTAIQLVEDGIASPAAIFLIAMTSSFIISAIFHPQEFFCLFHGCLYFLCVPSMYLFLILYSLINLNNVSWGTREVLKKKTKAEMEEEQVVSIKKKNAMPNWLENFGIGGNNTDEDGGISCSLSNLCRCMLCTHPKDGGDKYQLMRINDHLGNVNERLYGLETKFVEPKMSAFRRKSSVGNRLLSSVPEEEEDEELEEEIFDLDTPILEKEEPTYERTGRDDMVDPLWMEEKELKKAQVKYLGEEEIEFWRELIKSYLLPLDDNKEKQRKVSAELKDLRNKVISAFLMLNSLFVLVVFLLQVNKDQLHIEWPLGAKYIITFSINNNEVIVTEIPLRVDPIGIVFVLFFSIILIVQFFGMLFHRLGTMTHILASEELHFCSGKMEDTSDGAAYLEKNAIRLARRMQQLNGINGEDDVITESGGKGNSNNPARRMTIQALNSRQKENKAKIVTLDTAFAKRFFSISSEGIEGTPILSNMKGLASRRSTLKVLEEKRNHLMADEDSRNDILRMISETDHSAEIDRLNAAFPSAKGRMELSKQISNSTDNDSINDQMDNFQHHCDIRLQTF